MPDKSRKTHKPDDHLPTYQVVTSVVTGLHILDSLSWDIVGLVPRPPASFPSLVI